MEIFKSGLAAIILLLGIRTDIDINNADVAWYSILALKYITASKQLANH